jgi:hypothetical protein
VAGDIWMHANPEWQNTLNLARQLGWPTPVKAKAHGGLVLNCPSKDGRHKVRIYSTAKGAENVARQARRKIQNCAHRDLTEPLARIRISLDGAETLLNAADCLLDVAEADRDVEVILGNLDEADDQLAGIEAEFDAAIQRGEEASFAVGEAVDPSMSGETVPALVDRAGSELRSADLRLRDDVPSAHPDWESLRGQHATLMERLRQTRERANAW